MSNVTFSIFVPPSGRRKAGQFNVRIRVTYKRVSRYISTNIMATEKDLDAAGNLKGYPLVRASSLLGTFYQYSAEINFFALQEMDVDDVLRYIKRRAAGPESFSMDFFQFASELLADKSPGTLMNYNTALNALKRFLGSSVLDINDISKDMLQGFQKFLETEPRQSHNRDGSITPIEGSVKKNAPYVYLGRLRYIYEAAQHKYNDEDAGLLRIPRNPFSRVKVSFTPPLVRSAKSVEFIQRIIDFDGKCSRAQRTALDIYILSFALMGMNAADMLTAGAPVGDVVIYNRRKTAPRRQDQAEHHVRIDPRIMPLVEKYADPEGKYLFIFSRWYSGNVSLNNMLRYNLKNWAENNNEQVFTMYSARHSWATIARSSACRIDKGTIDDCLCHVGGNRLVDVYAEKDWSVLWDANKKVLDLFDWSKISK